MILGCLSLPFRLLGLALLVAIGYAAWVSRDDIRRWVHRATAESGSAAAEPRPSPAKLLVQAHARLDSLERRRADSVLLSPGELGVLLRERVGSRRDGLVDSLEVGLDEDRLILSGQVDGSRLPSGGLGPLAEWLKGRTQVEAAGPLSLRRVGLLEWRIERLRVRGLPLPRPLWTRLVGLVFAGQDAIVSFPVEGWVTGVRVTAGGAVLYGVR